MKKILLNKNLALIVTSLLIGAIGIAQTTVFADEVTTVAVDPSQEIVHGGNYLSINIIVDPSESIAGMQTDILFDPEYLSCNSVDEGNLFQGHSTYFQAGAIDNINGTIKNIVGVAIMGHTSNPGIFAHINFTTKQLSGTTHITLTNLGVGTPLGVALPVDLLNGTVTVIWNPWDVNQDAVINILDLILIGQHWMETGSPGWIAMDVNSDGIVNILDMILVGQHWTG
jgi:hypothetical protein